MADRDQLDAWIQAYVRAWNSNDPRDIGALFTETANYFPEPFAKPWHGQEEIVARWLGRKDEPGETEFQWEALAVTPDVAIVQGTTVYRSPPWTYSNLWVIRLADDGRCAEFTEWWMQHPENSDTE
jgi:ketosteroid isomerase-like protein